MPLNTLPESPATREPAATLPRPAGTDRKGWLGLPGQISLGKWFGIPVALEPSWFVIFALLLVSFSGSLAAEYPALGRGIRWSVAAALSVLLFLSVLLHEFAHSVVASRKGIPAQGITLMLFGGVSRLSTEPKRAKDDLAIALVGPLTSALETEMTGPLSARNP